MVDKKPVLEILIPTFNRSHSAQEAIENVLACNDERLTVRCNSNGFEPGLEKYRNLDTKFFRKFKFKYCSSYMFYIL